MAMHLQTPLQSCSLGSHRRYSSPARSIRGERKLRSRCSKSHNSLNFLEGAAFNLPDTFARDTTLDGKVFQRDRIIVQSARFEDAALTAIKNSECFHQSPPAVLHLLAFGELRLLI